MQGLASEDRYAFAVEWLDPNSGVVWKYQLLHQPSSREIEMVWASLAQAFPRVLLLLHVGLAK